MASLLITNIKLLAGVRENCSLLRGKAMAELPGIENAYLEIVNGSISAYGSMKNLRSNMKDIIDATGKMILPVWCDSHTHLVFPASREDEFVDKLKGLSYAEIAARGGGILNSASKLAETTEDDL